MTINDFIKTIKEHFPNAAYKATSKDGIVFKSRNWREYEIQSNKIQSK